MPVKSVNLILLDIDSTIEKLYDIKADLYSLVAVDEPKPEPKPDKPNTPDPEPQPRPLGPFYDVFMEVDKTLGIIFEVAEGEFFISAQPSWPTTLGIEFDQNDVMITFGDKPPVGARVRIVLSGDKHGNAG